VFRLIDSLGIRNAAAPGFIMSLIDQNCSILLEFILVRSVRSKRHEDDRMSAAQPKVHSALEAHSFAATHFKIRDDFIHWV
jgi:hypothetical protein